MAIESSKDLRCRRVVFSPGASQTFEEYRRPAGENEAGGILLGRVHMDGFATVEVATEPGEHDTAGTHFFVSSRQSAQQLVNDAWHQSGGEQIYLGEWHTHPGAPPNPSLRDRNMIRNMLRRSKMEIPFLILVVIGAKLDWIGVQTKSGLHPAEAVELSRAK